MTQRLKFVLHGFTAETTCSDEEAAMIAEKLREAWAGMGPAAISIGAVDRTPPMLINTSAVQMLEMNELDGPAT